MEALVGGVVGMGEWICWRRSRLEHSQRQELMLELALGHSTNRCWRMGYMATQKLYAPNSCAALFSWSKEEKENTTKTKHDKNKTKQYRKDHHRVILNNGSSSELVGERLACCVYCVFCAQTKGKQKIVLLRKCWNIGKLCANVDCIHLPSTQQIERSTLHCWAAEMQLFENKLKTNYEVIA